MPEQTFSFTSCDLPELTAEQVTKMFRRLQMGALEVKTKGSVWPGSIEVRLVVANHADSFPEARPSDEDLKDMCIPLSDQHALWVFFGEYYVNADGELCFE